MTELINWIARNNTLMIQSAFTIVLLLLAVYIYRLFFAQPGVTISGTSGADVSEINQKLEKLLQQQQNDIGARISAGTADSPLLISEIEKLRLENTSLKTKLNDAEKKVFELSPTDSLEDNNSALEKVAELSAKLEKAEARLSEYEIISEDIAELSQLRLENADLKKRINSASAVPAEATLEATVTAQPAIISDVTTNIDASTAEPFIIEESRSDDSSNAFDLEAELNALTSAAGSSDAESASDVSASSEVLSEDTSPMMSDNESVPRLNLSTSDEGPVVQTAKSKILSENASESSPPKPGDTSVEAWVALEAKAVEPEAAAIAETPSQASVDSLIADLNKDITESEKTILNDFERVIKKG